MPATASSEPMKSSRHWTALNRMAEPGKSWSGPARCGPGFFAVSFAEGIDYGENRIRER